MDVRPLQTGDQLPDLEGRALDGRPVCYREVWQKTAVVIVASPVPHDEAMTAYLADLTRRLRELTACETTVIVHDVAAADPATPISLAAGGASSSAVPVPAIVIADRWGEVRYIGRLGDDRLPSVDDIVEWLRFVQMECPECQGEAR